MASSTMATSGMKTASAAHLSSRNTAPLARTPRPAAQPSRTRVVTCAAGKLFEKDSVLTKAASVASAAALALTLSTAAPALASDTAAVGKCLLGKCQKELAGCIADEKCLESLVCLNACEFQDDISACQIKCGDLYSSAAVKTFNTCAVTENKCVPQIPDNGAIKVPKPEQLVADFKTSDFEGKWYIASGLNKLFDTFDCQVHYFNAPAEDQLYAKLNWRVNKSDGQFYERSDIQTFVQDPNVPGILYNHDNVFLHYQDDWYIVAENPENYIFVYYRGNNDAWDGYGGAVIYTREPDLDPKFYPEIREAAKKVGLDFNAFTMNNNKCEPAPPLNLKTLKKPTDLDTLYDDVIAVEKGIVREIEIEVKEVLDELTGVEKTLENDLVSFSRGFTVLKDQVALSPKSGEDKAAMKEKAIMQKKAERVMENVGEESKGNFISRLFGK